MRIDRKLNLVVELPRDEEGTIYAHATPISREVFDAYFLPMSVAFSRLWTEGLTTVTGPRVALRMLRKVSEERKIWDGSEGVEAGLVQEMRRLTNVVMRGRDGWGAIPLYTALKDDMLSGEEIETIDNHVCFFTLASALFRRRELVPILEVTNDLWGTSSVSSSCTEFAASLPTSTEDASFGGRLVVATSLPS